MSGQHRAPSRRAAFRAGFALIAALVLVTGAFFSSPTATPAAEELPLMSVEDFLHWCKQNNNPAFRAKLTSNGRTFIQGCANVNDVWASMTPTSSPTAGPTPTVAPTPTPAPSPTVGPTPTPGGTPTVGPTAPPTTAPPSPSPTPTPSPTPPPGDEWAVLRANAGPDIPTQPMACPGAGHITLSTAGAVFEGWTLTNCSIAVNAPNITIRNVRLVDMVIPEFTAIDLAAVATGTVITDVEVVGRDRAWQSVQYAVYLRDGASVTITRANFHQCADCVQGEHVVMRDTWIHHMANIPGVSHVDGFQCNSTCDGTLIEHNYIDMSDVDQTGCISFFADFGTPRNATARNNYLLGGGYNLYGGDPSATNIKILDNIVVPGQYGWIAHFNKNGAGNVATGNHKPDGTPLLP